MQASSILYGNEIDDTLPNNRLGDGVMPLIAHFTIKQKVLYPVRKYLIY